MKHYIIRYNHKHKTDKTQPIWRVFEDGREFYVQSIVINTKVYTESAISPDDGLEKWNIACDGHGIVEDDALTIFN